MDLKIKDVAELLSVSETTIRRWLTKGAIPAYKINHQYRFSRIEIENWMMQCKISATPYTVFNEEHDLPKEGEEIETPIISGHQQYSLYRALNRGDLYLTLRGNAKEEIIQEAMRRLAPKLNLDAAVLADLLIDRENLMPTSLNHGVAVPHARDFVLPTPNDNITVAFLETPIEYGALDGEPVHTLFFLFSSSDKRHLHLLSKIAHFCSDEKSLEFLKTRPSKEKMLDFVKRWECKLNNSSQS